MIDYYEQLTQEEKEEITEVIQTLYRQTFLLERKFDKRAGRMQYTQKLAGHQNIPLEYRFLSGMPGLLAHERY